MYILFPENISLFPLISWFVLYLILQAFTNQNATLIYDISYMIWMIYYLYMIYFLTYDILLIYGSTNPTMWRKILKNKVIQSEKFNMKESQRYNVSVSINYHQVTEKMLRSVFRSPMHD